MEDTLRAAGYDPREPVDEASYKAVREWLHDDRSKRAKEVIRPIPGRPIRAADFDPPETRPRGFVADLLRDLDAPFVPRGWTGTPLRRIPSGRAVDFDPPPRTLVAYLVDRLNGSRYGSVMGAEVASMAATESAGAETSAEAATVPRADLPEPGLTLPTTARVVGTGAARSRRTSSRASWAPLVDVIPSHEIARLWAEGKHDAIRDSVRAEGAARMLEGQFVGFVLKPLPAKASARKTPIIETSRVRLALDENVYRGLSTGDPKFLTESAKRLAADLHVIEGPAAIGTLELMLGSEDPFVRILGLRAVAFSRAASVEDIMRFFSKERASFEPLPVKSAEVTAGVTTEAISYKSNLVGRYTTKPQKKAVSIADAAWSNLESLSAKEFAAVEAIFVHLSKDNDKSVRARAKKELRKREPPQMDLSPFRTYELKGRLWQNNEVWAHYAPAPAFDPEHFYQEPHEMELDVWEKDGQYMMKLNGSMMNLDYEKGVFKGVGTIDGDDHGRVTLEAIRGGYRLTARWKDEGWLDARGSPDRRLHRTLNVFVATIDIGD